MSQHTGQNTQSRPQKLSQSGKRILIINIIFFVILFAGLFLVPFSGLAITIIVVVAGFVASILYTYLF